MLIRLTHELDDDPRQSIADGKNARRRPRPRQDLVNMRCHPHRKEQQQPFQQRFIELRGMPRLRPGAGKHHAPWHIRHPAIKLAVDEIRQPPEPKSDRHTRSTKIEQFIEADAVPPAIEQARHHHAQKPAVKRHPAVPKLQDLARIGDEIRRIVEQHITEPSAQHDAQRAPQQKIVELRRRRAGRPPRPQRRLRHQALGIPQRQQQPEDVGQRIPAHHNRPERKGNRVDPRKWYRGKKLHGARQCCELPARSSTVAAPCGMAQRSSGI